MKVLYYSYFEENLGGGLGRIAYDLAYAMTEKTECALIYVGKADKVYEKGKLKLVSVKGVGEGEFFVANIQRSNLDTLLNFLNDFDPDIIHLQAYALPISLILQLWGLAHNKKIIYTSHLLPSKLLKFQGGDGLDFLGKMVSFPLNEFSYEFYKNCDVIIALNKASLRDFEKIKFRGQIREIPNGRNLSLYNTRNIASMIEKERNLIFVGQISDRKNQLFLVEMMRYLPQNYQLYLIGPVVMKSYYRKILRFMRRKKIRNVHFIEQIRHEEIPDWYEKAHFFVSASKMEVQSLSIMEALASGTPVIALENETTIEFVSEENGYLFDAKVSEREFARKVWELSRLSEKEYRNLSVNAKNKMQDYDLKLVAEQTYNLYSELLVQASDFRIKEKKKNKILDFFHDNELRDYLERISFRRKKEKQGLFKRLNKKKSKPTLIFFVIILVLGQVFYFLMKFVRMIKTKRKRN